MAGLGVGRHDKLRRGRTRLTDAKALQGMKVWTTDAPAVRANVDLCFALVHVLSEPRKNILSVRQLEPPASGEDAEPYEITIDDAYNANPGVDCRAIPDVGLLAHKNCAAVLAFLRERYMQDLIYTTADPLLIAVNPFRDLQNTGPQWIEKYHGSTSTDASKEPHVFQVAHTALERLHSLDASQTIIVSGESGAGKTEATKQIMGFLAYVKNAGEGNLRIQRAVMAANPILEAFGNAKTIRNNNSSRFGRFMQLQVGSEGGILHGFIKNFLLEKVRVTQQAANERSYHIFYQLLSGASPSLKTSLHLLRPEEYVFLQGSGCYVCPNTDDAADFQVVERTFATMNFRQDEITSIWSIISGILLLGNVEFQKKEAEGVPDAADLPEDKKTLLSQCCQLLFLDPVAIEREFLFSLRVIGNQEIKSPVTISTAQVNRDSLAKALYEKLFDWIILRVNQTIQPPDGFTKFVGLLDIFGFEVFENNSLEQLLINITNEQLQKEFIQIVFARETELYHSEGIRDAKIEWTDNKEVVEALCGKTNSVLALLEDKSLAPGGTDESIVQALNKCLMMNDAWKPGRKNPRLNFIICHCIADIQYDATGFIAKNKDLLKSEICALLKASKNAVVRSMFEHVVSEKGKLGKGQLIASQFMRSVNALLELISSTETQFIRCLKPNETKRPKDWNNAKVLAQMWEAVHPRRANRLVAQGEASKQKVALTLFSLSILEALQLKNFMYSYRRPYAAFVKQFAQVDYSVANSHADDLPASIDSKRLFINRIIHHLRCAENFHLGSAHLGRTMVFVKPAAIREITQRMRELMRAWEPVVQVVETAFQLNKRLKLIKPEIPWAIRIQAHVRKAKALKG